MYNLALHKMAHTGVRGTLITIPFALIGYVLFLAFYRLFLSPLSKVPGPKLAALTFWYERYFDVFKRGRYVFKIKELHDQYGRFPTFLLKLKCSLKKFVCLLFISISKFFKAQSFVSLPWKYILKMSASWKISIQPQIFVRGRNIGDSFVVLTSVRQQPVPFPMNFIDGAARP